ncbi:MAG TPA: DoxX family membrane protein [Steroidobacteraceae bacterium]|nr:DoxX family membrane protein [Steroidobacteraceae bacterium]
MNKHALLYALAAILLGAIGIWFHDFAMQWQGVPKSIPAMPWAYVSGAILVAGGALILARREKIGALVLAGFYGLWVVAFHLPATIMNAIGSIGAWNAPAESGFITAGALALLAAHVTARDQLMLAARLLAGASAVVFGFAHFNYIDFTATMVPAWIPFKTFWAWATGAGHLLTGIALLTGIRARLAAACEAAMMGSFVVLLHLPRVIAAPDQHVEWIMLAISSALTGAALLVRKYATIGA